MWFVFRVNINQEGKETHSTQLYTSETAALKRFYNVLAADIDNDNFQYELVQVVNEDGMIIATQVFRNTTPPNGGES